MSFRIKANVVKGPRSLHNLVHISSQILFPTTSPILCSLCSSTWTSLLVFEFGVYPMEDSQHLQFPRNLQCPECFSLRSLYLLDKLIEMAPFQRRLSWTAPYNFNNISSYSPYPSNTYTHTIFFLTLLFFLFFFNSFLLFFAGGGWGLGKRGIIFIPFNCNFWWTGIFVPSVMTLFKTVPSI